MLKDIETEIMRLASLLATARVRKYAVGQGLGSSDETINGVEKRVTRAEQELYNFLVSLRKGTPAAEWRVNGEPDPHDDHYDKERSGLALGRMSDDVLANAAFLNYDVRPNLQDIIDGKAYSPIVYMTAVKERIRWLSRSLVATTTALKLIREHVAVSEAFEGASGTEVNPTWIRDTIDGVLKPRGLEES